MSEIGKYRGISLRLLFVIVLVIVAAIPVHTWAAAQQSSAPLWVVRSISTGEFGVGAPKGLAFSVDENAFLVLDGTSDATLISMAEEPAGKRAIPEVRADPLNTAFDKRTDSLFVFNRGRAELAGPEHEREGPGRVPRGGGGCERDASRGDPSDAGQASRTSSEGEGSRCLTFRSTPRPSPIPGSASSSKRGMPTRRRLYWRIGWT